MLRGAALLGVLAILVGCGSERERTAAAPAHEPAKSVVYDECQSVIAVGSSDDPKLTGEGRRALKDAREAIEEGDARCGTQYAPLPTDSPENAAALWVQAINAADWAGVCKLSVRFDNCPAVVEELFSEVAGRIEIAGFYQSQDRTTFAANLPRGLEPSVERQGDGSYLIHFEYAVID